VCRNYPRTQSRRINSSLTTSCSTSSIGSAPSKSIENQTKSTHKIKLQLPNWSRLQPGVAPRWSAGSKRLFTKRHGTSFIAWTHLGMETLSLRHWRVETRQHSGDIVREKIIRVYLGVDSRELWTQSVKILYVDDWGIRLRNTIPTIKDFPHVPASLTEIIK
jgi:hypothetical protein